MKSTRSPTLFSYGTAQIHPPTHPLNPDDQVNPSHQPTQPIQSSQLNLTTAGCSNRMTQTHGLNPMNLINQPGQPHLTPQTNPNNAVNPTLQKQHAQIGGQRSTHPTHPPPNPSMDPHCRLFRQKCARNILNKPRPVMDQKRHAIITLRSRDRS